MTSRHAGCLTERLDHAVADLKAKCMFFASSLKSDGSSKNDVALLTMTWMPERWSANASNLPDESVFSLF